MTGPVMDRHLRSDQVGSSARAVPSVALRRVYGPCRAAADWSAALVLLSACSPLLLTLIALVRCTSEGPAFYSQVRLGRGGKPFRICKLRTMTHRCEAHTGPVWSVGEDPRITPIGRWLRDTHLDELPQLWNVLRLEMSLIGPRPERPEIAARIEREIPEFRGRLSVKPGITGLAQMWLPADQDLHSVRRKLTYDLHYVRHFGPVLDTSIAFSTVLHFLGLAATAMSRGLVRRYALDESRAHASAMRAPGVHTVHGPVALDDLARAA
jgi:lipopolysaccharide/colanic/teichoic acid biosynthesis glycosyltransferase